MLSLSSSSKLLSSSPKEDNTRAIYLTILLIERLLPPLILQTTMDIAHPRNLSISYCRPLHWLQYLSVSLSSSFFSESFAVISCCFWWIRNASYLLWARLIRPQRTAATDCGEKTLALAASSAYYYVLQFISLRHLNFCKSRLNHFTALVMDTRSVANIGVRCPLRNNKLRRSGQLSHIK